MDFTAEGQRLAAAGHRGVPWRRWGPYLSDRRAALAGRRRPAMSGPSLAMVDAR
jgi:hypothetical protein